MKRSIIELVIVALFAVPIGARGLSALFTHRIWVTPRNSNAVEMVGASANLLGLGYLALALGLFAVWFAIRTANKKLGWALTGLCAASAGVGFAGAFLV